MSISLAPILLLFATSLPLCQSGTTPSGTTMNTPIIDPYGADFNRQQTINHYTYLSSEDIYHALHELSQQYPELTTLTTAQEKYGLPVAGNKPSDCRYDPHPGCPVYILTISDSRLPYRTHRSLPSIFISGALHGDERIGPTVTIETARLLLAAASCTSLPRPPTPDTTWSSFTSQSHHATTCRSHLLSRGITHAHRRWLARLVATRRIVVLPAANALGYERNRRGEGRAGDPNRDFPFDLNPGDDCMRTVAARAVNEVTREELFQVGVTFHAGMEAVGYEWGAPSYGQRRAADEVSQREVSMAYSRFGGSVVGGRNYPVGTMNELVYPVRGGMEDWSYAGSWDGEGRVRVCRPKSYGGYPEEKTRYGNGTLRVFNVLVETSDDKMPKETDLGTDEDLFVPFGNGNGHISRNVRLSLLAIDLAEPYVLITSVQDNSFDDDIVPLSGRTYRSCRKTKTIRVPKGGFEDGKLLVEWTVGGAITVDETFLAYAKWDDLPQEFDGGMTHPTEDQFHQARDIFHYSEILSGITRWHADSPYMVPPSNRDGASVAQHLESFGIFKTNIDVSYFDEGDEIAIFAIAQVDQNWSPSSSQDVRPQTHLVNARTNPRWYFESHDKVVQGRLHWFSIPVTMIVREPSTLFMDVSKRFSTADFTSEGRQKQSLSAAKAQEILTSHEANLVMVLLCWGAVFIVLIQLRLKDQRVEARNKAMRERVKAKKKEDRRNEIRLSL